MSQNTFNLIVFLFLVNMFAFIWSKIIVGIHRVNLKYKLLSLKGNIIDDYKSKQISKKVFDFVEDYIYSVSKRSKNISFLHIIWFNLFTSKLLAKNNRLPDVDKILIDFNDKEKSYIQEKLNKISFNVLEYMVYKSFILCSILLPISIFSLIGVASKNKIKNIGNEISSKFVYRNIILEATEL